MINFLKSLFRKKSSKFEIRNHLDYYRKLIIYKNKTKEKYVVLTFGDEGITAIPFQYYIADYDSLTDVSKIESYSYEFVNNNFSLGI